MRMTICRSRELVGFIAGAVLAPALLWAQPQDTTRRHVVRPGDTLWSLAVTYLGDGQRWRDILQLNQPSLA